MKIGVPRGLLYPKYHIFARAFLEELGEEIVVSPATNKKILDEGVSCCVDEACLPIKVFHGHVSWLRDKCQVLFVPRLMSIERGGHICPMFCGVIEMLKNSIKGLPAILDAPIYSLQSDKLLDWAKKVGGSLGKNERLTKDALAKALEKQLAIKGGFNDEEYGLKIGIIGHTYNVNDAFINMDIRKKLNKMGIGVITEDYMDKGCMDEEISKLYKRPFWSYARYFYGAAVSMYKNSLTDGVIYLSSFSCGIDSVMTELIKNELGDFPFMVLKLDEHTGEAGFNTRLDAFSDMLKRRRSVLGGDIPQYGQCGICRSRTLPGA